MKPRLLATAALAAVGITTVLTSAAPAAQAATVELEQDTVGIVATDGLSRITGTARVAMVDGHVTVRIDGTVRLETASRGCTSVVGTFVYADGSKATTGETPRACSEFGDTTTGFHLATTAKKDVVRYVVYLMRSTDATAPASNNKWQLHYVGDAPDSFGTAERLDHDLTKILVFKSSSTGWHTAFDKGVTDYRLSPYDVFGLRIWTVRSRVQGNLVWNPVLGGTAYLRVSWTYADGSVRYRDTGLVSSASPTLAVDLTSPDQKSNNLDVIRTDVSVRSGTSVKGAAWNYFLDTAAEIS